VNDRTIQNAGTPDAAWLPWLATQHIRRVQMDDLCGNGCRLVVVAPHPDDELLACGGLLLMRAERGLPSMVVAVTDGEASHGISDFKGSKNLGAHRAEESCAGLAVLGVPSGCVVRLGIPDGSVAACVHKIVRRLEALVKPTDVVVTTWSLDGHPDHEAASQAAKHACKALGAELVQAPVWMWHWAEPDDARIPWGDLVALDLPEHAVKAKQEALHCHQSQLVARSNADGPVLMRSIVERAARAQEYFFV
jgi:LmbE family N-acetylglucosaminyl deacetylase